MTPNLPYHHPRPEPKPLELLSRPQIAARVYALRGAMAGLADQSDRDGGAVFACIGAMKVALVHLEARLREMDASAPGSPLAAAVTSPGACERLTSTGADLADVIRSIAMDGARALARRGA